MSNLFRISNITTAYYFYDWKLKVFLTLQYTISNPGLLVLMCLILGISYFDAIFDCILWWEDKDNYQDDGFWEFRLNSYTLFF